MPSFVSVRLTKADRARVRAAAVQEGLTVSEWLRRLMARAVDEASRSGHEGLRSDRDSKLQRRRQ